VLLISKINLCLLISKINLCLLLSNINLCLLIGMIVQLYILIGNIDLLLIKKNRMNTIS